VRIFSLIQENWMIERLMRE